MEITSYPATRTRSRRKSLKPAAVGRERAAGRGWRGFRWRPSQGRSSKFTRRLCGLDERRGYWEQTEARAVSEGAFASTGAKLKLADPVRMWNPRCFEATREFFLISFTSAQSNSKLWTWWSEADTPANFKPWRTTLKLPRQ